MGQAKDIRVHPITKKQADEIVRSIHYSGKVDPRSQLHLGVFYRGACHGAMQFGPSIDKSKIQPLVHDTPWNGFLELNRLAFSDMLPKNSESRAMGYAFRLIRKSYPHIKWVISFADGTQCGDGTIYRAAGFDLTQIKKNTAMWRMPNGEVCCQLIFTMTSGHAARRRFGMRPDESFGKFAKRVGAKKLPGYQLRYVKILDPAYNGKKNYSILPYSRIKELGVGMYKGKRVESIDSDASGSQSEEDGANPISTLHEVRHD